jgi:hypothetical protein
MGDRMSETNKRCPVEGCERRISPRQIMCPDHWSQVPGAERARVREHKRTEESVAYAEAVAGAIRAVPLEETSS